MKTKSIKKDKVNIITLVCSKNMLGSKVKSGPLIPNDIDVVSRDDSMEEDFGHSSGLDSSDVRYIDVKSINHWLRGRVQSFDGDMVWRSIIASSQDLNVNGVTVRVMHPAIIAAGKSTLARMVPRTKDAEDIKLLNVSDLEIEAATKLMRNEDPDTQLRILRSTSS